MSGTNHRNIEVTFPPNQRFVMNGDLQKSSIFFALSGFGVECADQVVARALNSYVDLPHYRQEAPKFCRLLIEQLTQPHPALPDFVLDVEPIEADFETITLDFEHQEVVTWNGVFPFLKYVGMILSGEAPDAEQ